MKKEKFPVISAGKDDENKKHLRHLDYGDYY